jgi:hypothetical protein
MDAPIVCGYLWAVLPGRMMARSPLRTTDADKHVHQGRLCEQRKSSQRHRRCYSSLLKQQRAMSATPPR